MSLIGNRLVSISYRTSFEHKHTCNDKHASLIFQIGIDNCTCAQATSNFTCVSILEAQASFSLGVLSSRRDDFRPFVRCFDRFDSRSADVDQTSSSSTFEFPAGPLTFLFQTSENFSNFTGDFFILIKIFLFYQTFFCLITNSSFQSKHFFGQ